jgi:hypothetical protein
MSAGGSGGGLSLVWWAHSLLAGLNDLGAEIGHGGQGRGLQGSGDDRRGHRDDLTD